MEVTLISVAGIVVMFGLFLLMCPEWWSTSLGTLKEKKPREQTRKEGETEGRKTD
jgi:hypothetical protein